MTKDFENMNRAEKMIALLNIENRKEVNENLNETIENYKNGTENAGEMFEFLFEHLGFNNIGKQEKTEIKNDFLMAIKEAAGYCLKENYNFSFGGGFNNSLKESISTGSDIVGKDSNRIGDIYTRKKDDFGIYHQEPKAKKQDKDELDIQKKLELLKKLFLNRNTKEISIADIRKVLTSESEEQLISAKQFLEQANEKSKSVSENFVLDYYFSESSPITSTFSHNAYSGFKYVHLNKENIVTATNSFFVKVGNTLSKERIQELQNIGIKLYFSENLNEENTNDIIRKGKKIATDTENIGHYYVDFEGETFWIKGNKALNQGDTKDFIKKVKAGKIRFVKLSEGRLLEALHGDENILEEISYDEMLETVAVNIQAEEVQEKMVMFEFEKLLKIKIKSGRVMIKRAAKQIAIEVSHNNKRRIL